MTSRQRLLALLHGQPVDRCGVYTYGFDGFNEPRLKDDSSCAEVLPLIDAETEIMLGWWPQVEPNVFLSTAPEVCEKEERYAEDDHTITRRTLHTPRGDLHSVLVAHHEVEMQWQVEHYLKTDDDVERFLSMPYVCPEVHDNDFAGAQARIGERGLVNIGLADPICYVADLFEFGEFTVRAWQEPATIRRLLDMMAPRVHDLLDAILALGVTGVVFRLVGPEYASEPYLSPALFREFVTDYDLPIARKIRAAGCYLRVHSHGRLANILDQIMELEPDLLEPVEGPPSGDATMAQLARRVGCRCVLMGNLQPRDLEFVSPDRVDELVREIMESVAGHARLVVSPTDGPIAFPIAPVYARNIRRYVESVLKWGPQYDWNQ